MNPFTQKIADGDGAIPKAGPIGASLDLMVIPIPPAILNHN